MKNKFYITTSIMYANASPHVGFALELVQADVLARYYRQRGYETKFLTGTDEHGTTVVRSAEKQNKQPKELVQEVSSRVQELAQLLNISNDDFIRTSDQHRHWPGAEKIWKTLDAAGALYKKQYEGLYCVGHEAFIKKSDLDDGKCPLHKTEPEVIREENWFFALTKYKEAIREQIESDVLRIVPATRKQEILNLFHDAEDVSFSRPSNVLSWGIPVPGDSTQTMYVWADALTNYISALGYGSDEKEMKFWPADVHLIGKDILRFHAMIWPAMLLAAGLESPHSIFVHGFITVDGQKMSKTIGNVIDPFRLLTEQSSEVVRYFLLREIPSGDDGDFSQKNVESRYNGDLANGLGNFSSRVLTLASKTHFTGKEKVVSAIDKKIAEVKESTKTKIEQFKFHEALAHIWDLLSFGDAYINETQAWKQQDTNVIFSLVTLLDNAAALLEPFMPQTSQKITECVSWEGETLRVKKGENLFPRR